MTSQSLSNKHKSGFAPLLLISLRQFWTTILLFAIILFFLLPVPALMIVSDTHGYMSPVEDNLLRSLRGFAENVRLYLVPILSVFAVVVSCIRLRYLKNKVSVDYYHSLPIRRGGLYLVQLIVGAVSLIIPFLFNMLLTLLIVAVNGCMDVQIVQNLLAASAECVVYPLFFGALSTVVGMISGVSAVHLILTGIAIFIVPALYALMVVFTSVFSLNMWEDWYLNESILAHLSPVFRFLFNQSEVLSIPEALLMLLSAAVMFVGAYYIYLSRKSERAGTPVVFTPLGEVIKFVLVFIGTVGGGLLFYLIMNSIFWMIFGMICGTVLVFMLTNTILQKTARAMFRGWKPLCVYSIVIAVLFGLIATNAFSINSYVPSPAMTAKTEVIFGDSGRGVSFTDKACLEALHRICTEGETEPFDYPSPIWNTETLNIKVVFYPKIGLPIAKRILIYNKSDFKEEFRTLLDSKEFAAAIAEQVSAFDEQYELVGTNIPRFCFADDGTLYSAFNGESVVMENEAPDRQKEFLYNVGADLFAKEYANVGFDFFQNPTCGSLYAYHDFNYNLNRMVTIPIFTTMTDVTERLVETEQILYTPDDFLDKMAEQIDELTVCKIVSVGPAGENHDYGIISSEDGATVRVEQYMNEELHNVIEKTITDKKQIRQILAASATPTGERNLSPYTFADTQYYAIAKLNVSQIHVRELKLLETLPESEREAIKEQNTFQNTFYFAFLDGKVPAFVPALFE